MENSSPQEVNGDAIGTAFGHNQVGVALGGLYKGQVHGPHGLESLTTDAVKLPAALFDIAQQPADEAEVSVGVNEHLHIEIGAQTLVQED